MVGWIWEGQTVDTEEHWIQRANYKLYMNIWLWGEWVSLMPSLFKGQLYILKKTNEEDLLWQIIETGSKTTIIKTVWYWYTDFLKKQQINVTDCRAPKEWNKA